MKSTLHYITKGSFVDTMNVLAICGKTLSRINQTHETWAGLAYQDKYDAYLVCPTCLDLRPVCMLSEDI